eukprot:TRINITY_DN5701_c0_g1_i1.p1 TRINITY_DN5701_c0_g1~~TRINITY_DN5701_c0_g1_i1.p1  ORF type:complete len:60 (+),score=15.72 TRINITY_DN5701_c0_g1_i1:87-266(+)
MSVFLALIFFKLDPKRHVTCFMVGSYVINALLLQNWVQNCMRKTRTNGRSSETAKAHRG